jgi:CHAT domain-containing protein
MIGRFWVPAIGVFLLCACSPRSTVPDGTAVLDEDITLTRQTDKPIDSATRELTVEDDVILVAFVDENLTDVKLGIATIGGDDDAPKPVVVENNMTGAGIEIAVLDVPEGARVRVTLTNPQDAVQPGKVHLRVRQYSESAVRDPKFAAQLTAYRAWTAATDAAFRVDDVKKTGLPAMQRAIDSLEDPQGDAALAAQARLVKARMLHLFRIDWREARAEAQRAAAAFARLAKPDEQGGARAKYVEALALIEMSNDREAREPTAEEAKKAATDMLNALSAPTSVFGPIERARAITALGQLELRNFLTDAADKHFEEARAIYKAEGHTAGEREMRCNLAMVLVERGDFGGAAQAIGALTPEIELIADPELRVKMYAAAGRAQSFSGNADAGAELLLKALPLAQQYQLRQLEGITLQGLGYIYQDRGDMLAASSFFEEALKIARDQKDVLEYVQALASAGAAARSANNLDRAFELHEEAVRLAPTPVAQVRTRLDLGVDHYRKGDIPAAIAEYRKSLAVDLHDPNVHIFTDGKLGLAQFLIENEKRTPQDLEEAARLIAEGEKTSIKMSDEWRVIWSTEMRATLDARLGRISAALAGYEKVFQLSQEYRLRSSSIESRSGMLKSEEYAFRGYLDIVFSDVAKRGTGAFRPITPAELAGLQRLERARHESFGALRVGTLDPKSAARADQLLDQMGQKSLRIAALVKGDLDAARAAELRTLQIDMARLHAELDHVRTSAAASSQEKTRSWRALAPDSAQLSYAQAQDHVYAVVRSEAGTIVTVLGPSRKALDQQLTELAELDVQTSSPQIEAALEKISSVLLPAGLLPEKSSAVEIVAEGRIASVPFPALRSPTDPKRRLIETHVVKMVTSLVGADDAPRARQARPFRFVALASGSGTYRRAVADPKPRLQAATKEIRIAADLFTARDASAKVKLLLGAEGTAAALRDIWASGADVVHFATHALADLRQPVASLLVLPATDTSGNSTYLTAGQVQAWRGDAELVFLSACDSAIGPPQYAAGMPGLQRAFLRAGARGVIATLAPIEDVLAQQFAADFYTRYTSGQPAAQALSETQRAWVAPKPGLSEGDQLRRRITALAHGFYAQ